MSELIQIAPANADLAAEAARVNAMANNAKAKGGRGFAHEAPGGGSVEYYTPNWVMQGIDTHFDMDIASPKIPPFWMTQWIDRFVDEEEDGLKVEMYGKVWVNPPYGDLVYPFFKRMAEHNNGMGLVFCRPGSEWFQEFVLGAASAVFYMRRRIRFWGPDGQPIKPICKKTGKPKASSPGADSVIIAWGDECADILIEAEQTGRLEGKVVDHRGGRWW